MWGWASHVVQAIIVVCGAVGLAMVGSPRPRVARRGFLIAALAQPFWLAETIRQGQWGMALLAAWLWGVYLRGAWRRR